MFEIIFQMYVCSDFDYREEFNLEGCSPNGMVFPSSLLLHSSALDQPAVSFRDTLVSHAHTQLGILKLCQLIPCYNFKFRKSIIRKFIAFSEYQDKIRFIILMRPLFHLPRLS